MKKQIIQNDLVGIFKNFTVIEVKHHLLILFNTKCNIFQIFELPIIQDKRPQFDILLCWPPQNPYVVQCSWSSN